MATQTENDRLNSESSARSKRNREEREIKKAIRTAEREALASARSIGERREIKREYGQVYDDALSYVPPNNEEAIATATNDTFGNDSFSFDESPAGGESGIPEGYEETDVILCQNGSPVSGSILFKPE